MAEARPQETVASDALLVTGARTEDPRFRGEFGGRLIWAFVIGLAFFGSLIGVETAVVALGGDPFLKVDDIVKLATTFGSIIGPPLGFVISYYFKERET